MATQSTIPQYDATGGFTSGGIYYAPNSQQAINSHSIAGPSTNSTTTLSNQNVIDQVPGIVNTTHQLSQTGTQTDQNGNATYANGTQVQQPQQQPEENPATTDMGGYYGEQYIPAGSEIPRDSTGNPVKLSDTSPAHTEVMNNLNTLKAQVDKHTASAIDNIQAQYNQLIQQQQQANKASQASVQNSLLMGGVTGQGSSAQYAPVSSAGILQAQVNYGIQQITDLNTKEQTAIITAQKAGDDEDYQLMDKMNTEITKIRDEKVKAATDLQDKIAEENKKNADGVNEIALEAAKNGADPATLAKIGSAGTIQGAILAAGGALQTASGQLGDYLQYKRDTVGKGLTPMDYGTWKAQDDARQAKQKSSEAYSSAYASAAGKAAAEAVAGGTTGTKNLKPLTEVQAKDFTYAQRGDNAQSIIDNLSNKIVSMNPVQYSIQKTAEKTGVGNTLVSDEIRQIAQAERNFVTAVLRRESGAAISASEFNTAEKQYFPRPGDDATTLAQKEEARRTAINSFKANVPSYEDRISNTETKTDPKTSVDDYIKQNPARATEIAKLYNVPGSTDADVWEYIQQLNKQ